MKEKKVRKIEPLRLIWADSISKGDLKELRKEVEKSIKDPSYTIVCNYRVNWEEIEINKDQVIRVVWADCSIEDMDDLKSQINAALKDHKKPIVTNYNVNIEMGQLR